MGGRAVLHVDFDCFYAQCEELRRPGLRGRPVVVCAFSARGGGSGAVATANYEARRFGVGSGMPISAARARIPAAEGPEFLPADMGHYSEVSRGAMDIVRGFADRFEHVGRDEAYLDVTASSGGDCSAAARAAQRLKNAVRSGAGLTCSVGVSPNRLVSKIASAHRKPDGLTVVPPGSVEGFLEPLRIRDVPGVGGKAEKRLAAMGVRTVGQLRSVGVFELQREFGRAAGGRLYGAARGEDDTPVEERGPNVQFSRIVTLSRDSSDEGFVAESLPGLCADLAAAASRHGVFFKSVGVQLVLDDMSHRTRSQTLRSPASGEADILRAAGRLLGEALAGAPGRARRLGVVVSDLSPSRGQMTMDGYV